MITAVLIDDDDILRNGMKGLLKQYAPNISIIGEADSVLTGTKLISTYNPQVVFLDIQLNDGTGFDILEQLKVAHQQTTPHIVFITAHEQYAIKAFRFSALDFLLKPVDPFELESVIQKITSIIENKQNNSHIDLLLENISKKVDNFKRIALSNSDGIHLFNVTDIIRCESLDNYTKFYVKNSKPIMVSKTLKDYEELLTDHGFFRIHQSHLINLSYMKTFIKKDGAYIVMTDDSKLPISQRKKDSLIEIISKY